MERSIADIDVMALTAGRTFFPSPVAWEDQVLYFLLLDRFSDGQEIGYRDNTGVLVTSGTTPPFQPADRGNPTQTSDDHDSWLDPAVTSFPATLPSPDSTSPPP